MGLGFQGDIGLRLVAQGSFFYLGCKHLPRGLGGVGYRDVRAWCRSLKGLNGSIPAWVEALRQCASEEQAVDILQGSLGSQAPKAGEGVFLAFVRRRWALGRLKSDEVRELLATLSRESRTSISHGLQGPEAPSQSLGDAVGVGGADALPDDVDGQLLTFFQQFEGYDGLIPKTLW